MAARATGAHGALTPALYLSSCGWQAANECASAPSPLGSLCCKDVAQPAGRQFKRGGVIERNLHVGVRRRQHCKAHCLNDQHSQHSFSSATDTITANRDEHSALCKQKLLKESASVEGSIKNSGRHEKPHWLGSLTLSRRELILIGCTTPLIASSLAPPDSAIASAFQSDPTQQTIDLRQVEPQQVQLVIGDGCDLGVSVYPDFEYNAGGKGGAGTARKESDGRIFVRFDPATLQIPPVQFSTTKFLALPLPPPLKIEIVSKKLEGYIEPETGKVSCSCTMFPASKS